LIVFDWEGTLFNPAAAMNHMVWGSQGPGGLGFFDGMLELLHALKAQNYRLAIATGKSRASLDVALQAEALAGIFDATRTPDESAAKPHPQMLLELMLQCRVTPKRTLMVGDTPGDLWMAKLAGCQALGVCFEDSPHPALRDALVGAPSVFIARSVRALSQWLL
jgi:phosphoglycolate phosphatase